VGRIECRLRLTDLTWVLLQSDPASSLPIFVSPVLKLLDSESGRDVMSSESWYLEFSCAPGQVGAGSEGGY